ncbi:putative Zinc finger protein [Quillaja saponaria]|uniref:Zinc finger protein n=1 Tax=Quillaja saponaria TaxID=32244 RepID=A0AAD7VCF2_QUISA|nr:putative Zinc finger protein [Quillaja saponaria]
MSYCTKFSKAGGLRSVRCKMGFEDDPDTRYGLRGNLRKSLKFSGQESVCKVCDKGFESMRALFGHTRHHSGKQKKGIFCKECGEGFHSLRALTVHMKTHSEGFKVSHESGTSSSQKLVIDSLSDSKIHGLVVRRKRSRRTRYKIGTNLSFPNLNESSYVPLSKRDVEEGALCLMMLSRGVKHWDCFINSAAGTSENNSVTLEFKSSYQISKRIPDANETGNIVCDDERRFASDREKKNTLEVPIDIFCENIDYKMPRLHRESEILLNGTDSEMEGHVGTEVQLSEVEELGDDFLEEAGLDSMKYSLWKRALYDACDVKLMEKSGNKMYNHSDSDFLVDTQNKGEYNCKTSDKVFLSRQDLDGHHAVHKKNFSEFIAEDSETDNHERFFEQGLNGGTEVSYEVRVSKGYKCSICFKVFPSGQALGGHKRAHTVKNSRAKIEQGIRMRQEISDDTAELDLNNIPVMLKESADVDTRFTSWIIRNDNNHELLVV